MKTDLWLSRYGGFILRTEREFFYLRLEHRDGYSEKWFSIPLDAPCNVEANKIYDMSLSEVVITERVVNAGGEISFNYIVQTPSSTISNVDKRTQYYSNDGLVEGLVKGECAFSFPACDGRKLINTVMD